MVEVTSVAIAVTISVAITVILYFYKEKKLEPEKWKKNTKKELMEKRLEAYGSLLNFLEASEIRGKRWNKEETGGKNHLLIFPGDGNEFTKIFSQNRHLYSLEIIKKYQQVLKEDETYLFSKKPWGQDEKGWYELFDLKDIHQLIEKEFNSLKDEYEKSIL